MAERALAHVRQERSTVDRRLVVHRSVLRCLALLARVPQGPTGRLRHTAGMTQALFRYDPEIVARFSSAVGGILHVTGARNGPTAPALAVAFRAEQAAVLARLGDASLSEVPSLNAWRRALRAFGVDPTAYRSASEALLRRPTKQGAIPSINTLVDIGNLVSIRYALPVAVFDLASVSGGLTVRIATGSESFTDLGSGQTEAPDAGEVILSMPSATSPLAAGAGDSQPRARAPQRPRTCSSPLRATTTAPARTCSQPRPT